MKVSALIPQLRFNPFDDEWKITRFEDELVESKLGGNYANCEEPTDYPLIKMGNLGRGGINLRKLEYIQDGETINPNDKIKDGDLFFNTRNTLDLVGKVAIWRSELPTAYYNSNLMRIGFSCNHFMNYRLNSFEGVKSLRRLATGTTSVAAIYTRDLLKLKLIKPTLPEQQKIASFLSSVDTKIEQLGRKQALLEAYKKGCMQQIFSQQIRIKDDRGNPFPDWKEKKLGNLTKWASGGTPSKDKGIYWNGDIPWFSAASMHERYYHDSPLRITNEGLKSGSRLAKSGTLLLLVRGSMLWNRIPVGITKRDVAFNQDVKAITPNSTISAEFLLQWFIASENALLHKVVGTGIGAGKLDTDEMKALSIQLPHPDEQQKIADFLTELDRKIDLVRQELAQAKDFKKGLLQQMFV